MNDLVEQLILEVDKGLRFCTNSFEQHKRDYPAKDINENKLNEIEKNHSAGLMRVNHAGEVCAQALYRGQALVCKDQKIKEHLIEAGEEETDHLVWCKKRLDELDGKESILNPLWYAGSFAIGAIFGRYGEKVSLGFVEETEKQVVVHLDKHLNKISSKDKATIEILKTMREDEDTHAQQAVENGGEELEIPTKKIMKYTAKAMTSSSRYI